MMCKLCKNKEADQTGAHIFNFALIREIYNPKDNKNRGKEIVYGISTKDFLNVYFGNGIQPEEIQQLKGRDLTDEEIEKNCNPFTVDNIWCRECEGKFKVLEDYFMDNLYLKLRNQNKVDNYNSSVIRLYIYSLYWRVSVTNYCNFKLSDKEESKLRSLLLYNAKGKVEETIELAGLNSRQIKKMPLIFNYQEPQDDITEHIILADLRRNPYLLIINNVAFQLFFKDKLGQCEKKYYFGLNDFGDFKKSINLNEEKLKITQINKSQSKDILNKVNFIIAKQKTSDFKKLFIETHLHFFRVFPLDELIRSFMAKLTNDRGKLAHNYSFEHFVRTMYDFFADLAERHVEIRHITGVSASRVDE